jgi:hypothetical protein
MSDRPQLPELPADEGYRAGGALIVSKLPDEVGVPLRLDQFEILCEGEVADARASRDLCLGILFGAVVGIVGIVATVEWSTVLTPEHRFWFLLSMGVLVIMVAGSAVGGGIYEFRRRRTLSNSSYSRLVARLKQLYDAR